MNTKQKLILAILGVLNLAVLCVLSRYALPGAIFNMITLIALVIIFVGGTIFGVIRLLGRSKETEEEEEEDESALTIDIIMEMTPDEFAMVMQDLMATRSFHANLFGGASEEGVVLLAIKNDRKYVMQCKRLSTQSTDAAMVQELQQIRENTGAEEGWYITTTYFTKDALKFAEDKTIKLVDRDELREWLRVYAEEKGL